MGYNRNIKEGTKRMLYMKSGNLCTWCKQRLVYSNSSNLSEICHIEAVNEDGARYNPNLTNEYVNSYENLILLCANCHTLADNKYNLVKSSFDCIMNGIIHNNLSTCSHRCKLLDSFSKTTSDSCRHNYKCCFLHKYFPPDILLSYQYFFSHLLSHTLSAIFYSAS